MSSKEDVVDALDDVENVVQEAISLTQDAVAMARALTVEAEDHVVRFKIGAKTYAIFEVED